MCVIRRLIRVPLQLAVLVLFAFISSSLAYGPLGHEIVGAIADRKLAGTLTAEKIKTLLDGIPPERASLIANDIKSWDKNGPDDRRRIHFLAHPEIEQQLHDFWKANPPSPDASDTTPSHHWMHYTDVPVLDAEKYGDGRTGRGNWDVVHTIPYCIGVLRGEIAEDNPRKITRTMAVILLAHCVGDIHQPLHVGAEYFNEAGEPIDCDRGATGLGGEGGNSLSLGQNATAERTRHYYHSFHAYWGLDAVRNLTIGTPDEVPKAERESVYAPAKEKLIADFVANEPKIWRTSGDPKTWAEQWANEILPIAREAHTRVRFEYVHREEKDGHVFAKGEAHEIGTGYLDWSTAVVGDELPKAGWRLAELLQKVL